MSRAEALATLEPILEVARQHGFLGPGPVAGHMTHALGFVEVVEGSFDPPATVLDLGTGGGVPGLVLAACWAEAQCTFVEIMARRACFLRDAIATLGWEDRVGVVEQRAELVARLPHVRERADVVTARSFAEPPATAEIGSALARPGGILVVSEPPVADPLRWPLPELGQLSLGPPTFVVAKQAHFARFSKVGPSPTSVPRAVGKPSKRPLW